MKHAPQGEGNGPRPMQHEVPSNNDWSERVRRDPLLHRAIVTPPCPIRPGQNETPKAARTYTHVS
jgi:hypothetical protein